MGLWRVYYIGAYTNMLEHSERDIDISVVIPVHNEAGNITSLDKELHAVLKRLGRPYEVIYINDVSTDETLLELKALTGATILDLNRNYGQATAFDAGFRAARGSIVISMDGDGQNDPADIPRLIHALEKKDLDVVAGWRKVRSDKKGIRILTRIGRALRRLFISDIVHDTGCSLRAYRTEAVKSLDIGGEMHRYILALLRWKGFRIGEIVVNDRMRVHGKSKYNYTKAARGFIDLVYIWFIHKYSQRPLHLFGYLSLMFLTLGILAGGWTLFGKIWMHTSLNRNGWTLVTFFFMLSSIILFSFGIVTDLLMKIVFNSSNTEKRYYIRHVWKDGKKIS